MLLDNNYKKNMKGINVYIKFFVFSLLFYSCSNNSKSLSYGEKVEIIAKVFSDSVSNPKTYFKNCIFLDIQITNPVGMDYTEPGLDSIVTYDSYTEYVSRIFNENDTLFVSNQIVKNREFKINKLREYGFKFQEYDAPKYDSLCYISISKPLFNKNEDKFYLIIKSYYTTNELIFKKHEKKMGSR